MQTPPVVLSISALDPSGCGGLQADIETAASLGCHCAPIASAICSTGSTETTETIAVDANLIIEQARSVLEDMPVKAIKVGYTGSVRNVEAIHSIVQDYPQIPLIIHPAFCLWDDAIADQSGLPSALATLLFPIAHVAVISLSEAHILVRESDNVDASAQAITSAGCRYLLVNQTGRKDNRVRTALYDTKGLIKNYEWNQTPPICHGSSSTLASAIASLMAHDSPAYTAVDQAQNYTWQTLASARRLGFGKPTPYRMFWADKNIDQPGSMPAGNHTH